MAAATLTTSQSLSASIINHHSRVQKTTTATHDRIGLDIGGSLTKLVYTVNGRLHLDKFATDSINEVFFLLERLIQVKELQNVEYIVTTGGGSHKFYDELLATFTVKNGIDVLKVDEMDSLIYGLDFLINDTIDEVFIMNHENEQIHYLKEKQVNYPYLLVNIGSGVSILKVNGPNNQFERVCGSSFGGGSLWGLLSLLTTCEDYDSMLELSEKGNNSNVDMLVRDIYGTDYNSIGLKSSTIASTFGKVFKEVQKNSLLETPIDKQNLFKESDMAKSLIYSISNNIGQIAYLHANIHNAQDIFFGGSYISNHKSIIKTLSYAINFWSKGEMQANFLRHDGYIGAIGSFLTTNPVGAVNSQDTASSTCSDHRQLKTFF